MQHWQSRVRFQINIQINSSIVIPGTVKVNLKKHKIIFFQSAKANQKRNPVNFFTGFLFYISIIGGKYCFDQQFCLYLIKYLFALVKVYLFFVTPHCSI